VVGSFAQQAPSDGSYAPQSGQIFGILKNMKESFEANLAAAGKDGLRSVRRCPVLSAGAR